MLDEIALTLEGRASVPTVHVEVTGLCWREWVGHLRGCFLGVPKQNFQGDDVREQSHLCTHVPGSLLKIITPDKYTK